MIFNADGTVTQLSGDLKCDSSEPDEIDGGNWTLTNDSQLTISDNFGDNLVFNIISISSSKMDLEIRENVGELATLLEVDLTTIQGVEGYQDLINSDIIQILHLRPNN